MNYPNLRAEMARKGMTQNDLAKKVGLNPTAMHRRLTGSSKMTLEEAKRIADVLDQKLDYLFAG